MSGRAVTTGDLRRVRELWAAGARDTHIAVEIGRSQSTIYRARQRLGLTANYGPGRPSRKESRS